MERQRGRTKSRNEGGRLQDEDLPLPASDPDLEDTETDDPGFTEQQLDTDLADAIEDGDVYVPPTDPVVTTGRFGETEVLGGTEPTSADAEIEAPRSAADGRVSDDTLESAIRERLRLDAATTDLEPAIIIGVRDGVARLRGTVPSLEDAENVEAVAAAVAGVSEVLEELTIEGL